MSKSRPIDVAANVRTFSLHQLARLEETVSETKTAARTGPASPPGRRESPRPPALDVVLRRRLLECMAGRRCATRCKTIADAAHEQLASPDRPIVTVAGAVEGRRRARACPTPAARRAPTRRARGGAGRRAAPQPAAPAATRGRGVLWVRIVRRRAARRGSTPYILIRSSIVSRNARRHCVLIEVADVLAYERLAVDHERDRVLQVAADGKHWPLRGHLRDRAGAYPRALRRTELARRPSARTTESSTRRAIGRSPTRNASASPVNRSNASSSSIRDRLARTVGARHHQDIRRTGGEQQMVQRCVGQHHAELVVIRRHATQCRLAPARSRSVAPSTREAIRPPARTAPRANAQRRHHGPSARTASPCGTSDREASRRCLAFRASQAR